MTFVTKSDFLENASKIVLTAAQIDAIVEFLHKFDDDKDGSVEELQQWIEEQNLDFSAPRTVGTLSAEDIKGVFKYDRVHKAVVQLKNEKKIHDKMTEKMVVAFKCLDAATPKKKASANKPVPSSKSARIVKVIKVGPRCLEQLRTAQRSYVPPPTANKAVPRPTPSEVYKKAKQALDELRKAAKEEEKKRAES